MTHLACTSLPVLELGENSPAGERLFSRELCIGFAPIVHGAFGLMKPAQARSLLQPALLLLTSNSRLPGSLPSLGGRSSQASSRTPCASSTPLPWMPEVRSPLQTSQHCLR